MAMSLLNTWAAAVIDWASITPANVITWMVMGGGWIAFWVKLKDRVDTHSDQFLKLEKDTTLALIKQQETIEEQRRVIETMQTQGSPASRQAAIVMNSRLESQNGRLMRIEDAILEFAAIKTDVGWIKMTIQERHK